MNVRSRALARATSVAAVSVVLTSVALPAAQAADGGVEVVNTETVQVYTSPTGEVKTRRVYEQLSLRGKGTVDVKNPISTSHLRNLDGFGGFDVKNGEQITRTTVDGEKKLRSVSDYHGDLPLDVKIRYLLDGRSITPGDLVGKSGKLEVKYTVTNVTAKSQEVSFDDGKGGTITKTVDVPVPMVGSLSLVAPSSFTNVDSAQANRAGDGKGGTKLSFTMTLFPPIGSTTANFGYTADVKDAVVPRAEISALPVNPLESPTFKTAADSYKGGADTGAELTDGASQIDSNLLKLRDGANDLLAGLIKLRDGAGQLNAGLAGEAAPGAGKLADGASKLDSGLGQINSGAKRLAEGTGELRAGTGTLKAGVGKLQDGAGKLAAGASDLSDGTAKASAGSKQLYAGTKDLSAGATKVSSGATTVDGYMKQIAAGQGDLLSGLQLLEAGVKALPTSVQTKLATDPQYQALLGGMQSVVDGIGSPTDVTNPATGLPATVFGGLNAIRYGLRNPAGYGANDCAVKLAGGTPTKCGAMDGVQSVSEQLGSAATTALPALITNAQNTYDAIAGCPARTDTLPPLTALGVPACVDAAKVLIGLAAPKGSTALGLPLGGVQSQSAIASASLADIYQQVDAGIVNLALPKLRAAMNNPNVASPDCRVGAATADPTDDCGIQQAVGFFKANIPVLVNNITASVRDTLLTGISAPAGGCTAATKTLICGAGALATGGSSLATGTGDLAAGASQLSDGAALLSSKTGELSAGLGQIDDGAGKVAGGAGQLADGTNQLAAGGRKLAGGVVQLDNGAARLADGTGTAKDGSGQLAAGAGKLASGLKDAADGSGQLAGGLKQAAGGAPKIVDGAQQLSDKGTKKLVQAGEMTAQNYGELYATMTAGAKRAQTEDMAYGAPEGAVGLTAYSYIIQGDDGEGGRNLTRGVGGLALLGAGGAVFALRRRFI